MKSLHNRKGLTSFSTTAWVFFSLLFLSACSKETKTSELLTANSLEAITLRSLSSKAIDTGGLVAWYSFDGGSLKDVSAYHNKIIFNNATPAPDRNGVENNAYHFSGNGSYMRVKNSSSLSPASNITLFAIMKFDDFYEGACHGNNIICKGLDNSYFIRAYDGYYHNGTSCYQDVDKAHETFQTSFKYVTANDTTQQYIQTGKWYHVIYIFGSGIARMYVDGKLVGATSGHISNVQPNSYDLYIGGGLAEFGYPYWFNGTIDQIAVFNRTINQNQIARLSAY